MTILRNVRVPVHEDPTLETYVRDHRICLEVCLTSNVQTRVAADVASHPARRYYDLGIPVSLATDNRLVSGTTLTREYQLAHDHLGFTPRELATITRTGFDASVSEDGGDLPTQIMLSALPLLLKEDARSAGADTLLVQVRKQLVQVEHQKVFLRHRLKIAA